MARGESLPPHAPTITVWAVRATPASGAFASPGNAHLRAALLLAVWQVHEKSWGGGR